MDFRDKLQTIADPAHRPTVKSLTFLSDISREDRAALREAWPALPPDRRRFIARTLVDLAEDNIELDFRTALQVLLDDPDESVRLAAVEGLWEDESLPLLTRLLELLAQDPAPAVRAAAALALGRYSYLAEVGKLRGDRPEQIRRGLLTAARAGGEDIDVRRRALESLGNFGKDPEVRAQIDQAYTGPGKLPISAVYAMGRSMDARWAATLLHELTNPQAEMRYEAARAVGELGDQAHVTDLIPLLTDTDTEVRQAAIWALGQLGGRPAALALLKYRDSEEPAIREAVQDALNELRYNADPLSIA
jgi:HEAT repeat protein